MLSSWSIVLCDIADCYYRIETGITVCIIKEKGNRTQTHTYYYLLQFELCCFFSFFGIHCLSNPSIYNATIILMHKTYVGYWLFHTSNFMNFLLVSITHITVVELRIFAYLYPNVRNLARYGARTQMMFYMIRANETRISPLNAIST